MKHLDHFDSLPPKKNSFSNEIHNCGRQLNTLSKIAFSAHQCQQKKRNNFLMNKLRCIIMHLYKIPDNEPLPLRHDVYNFDRRFNAHYYQIRSLSEIYPRL